MPATGEFSPRTAREFTKEASQTLSLYARQGSRLIGTLCTSTGGIVDFILLSGLSETAGAGGDRRRAPGGMPTPWSGLHTACPLRGTKRYAIPSIGLGGGGSYTITFDIANPPQ